MATVIRASVVCLLLVFLARPSLAAERWSEAKANAWHDKQPWLIGCNFGPSTAINQLEMWQADTFDIATIDRELGWAADLGFTSIRVFLHHLLWQADSKGLLKRMEQFLDVAEKHGIGVMFVPLDDVWDPFPKTGKQREPKPHLHNSGWVQSPGIEVLKDPARHDELEGYIKGVIGHFKDDKRVHVWDLYNEPGNPNTSAYGDKELPNKEEMSVKLLRKAFAWAREAKASQPLTSGVWIGTWADPAKLRPIERVQLEQSDVISFHTYADLKGAQECVQNLRRYNRPILCTEYMARPNGSTFDPILGWFKAEKIGAYNWGFVAGKTQTIYPWDSWKKTYTAEPPVWFHDIFRADGTPYIADEVRYIREVTGKAKPASKTPAGAGSIPLSTLDLKQMSSGWGKPQIDKSVAGKPLCIGEQTFAHGVGTHANSEFRIELDGKAERFHAMVGVDAAAGGGDRASVEFILYDEQDELWRSGVCKLGEAPRECDVPLEGVKFLTLAVTDADDGVSFDHANWAEAMITFKGAEPRADVAPVEEAVILTPPPAATPRINGPTIYGVRPGSLFLYRIPATGERPMTFAAENLPGGLTLDAKSGIITGRLTERGEYPVTLIARNARGEASRKFRIVVGDTLALTPPMGWNSWYIHYHRVSDAIMREAADAMIESGMADYGYQYVNIDDCWMVRVDSDDPEIGGPVRDDDGRILCNKRFPDMKAMTDYIHAKGLKAGTYTSPGPRTCGGYAGAYQHEALDAKTFAEWGFDFLKYDWCSYREVAGGKDREHLIKPYQLMWDELQKLDRDIVFNLCQYGMGNVWEWGGQVGHCWRTTGDLGAVGGSLSAGIFQVGLVTAELADYAGPGHWNDPDYILIGWVGDLHGAKGKGGPTKLTPNEQYTHMSMWCLMAAPLVFSGDMSRLDPFTLNILCNHEVIDVDQDALGRAARIVKKTRTELVLAKEMEDGSRAVGLFNLGPVPRKMTADFAAMKLTGPQRIRDLWRQKDLGEFAASFEAEVPRHGVVLIRLRPKG